ncbi:MAG: hypothetical protein H7A48_13870 [Akkermansiaceae bacterium]|nr:hypothetical protein [Akkermansiaceae bacterium]MCP5547360.1 hypothetical protein [Akkermansiaceae bacterium]
MDDPLIARLKKIPDEEIEAALRSCLSATTTNRSGATEPDARTRLAAADLIIRYRVGRPREAPEPTPKAKGVSADDVFERAKETESYRKSMLAHYERMAAKLRSIEAGKEG